MYVRHTDKPSFSVRKAARSLIRPRALSSNKITTLSTSCSNHCCVSRRLILDNHVRAVKMPRGRSGRGTFSSRPGLGLQQGFISGTYRQHAQPGVREGAGCRMTHDRPSCCLSDLSDQR